MSELFNPFQPTLTQSGLSHFGLSLQSSAPCITLKGIVHSYLQIKATKATPYSMIPDASIAIFISVNGSIVGGAQMQSCDMQILDAGEYFGIRFHAGGLRHFFNIDLTEITGQFVDHQYLLCRDFARLHQKIYEQSSYLARVKCCESWLLGNYRPQPLTRFDQALSLIYQSNGNIRVNQLAHNVQWSSRHLNRLFSAYTGLSTKSFSKIIRMQSACKQLYNSPCQSLLDAQLDLGFFDQSHLIKDFRQHLLAKPTTFLNHFMSDFYNQ